VYHLLELVRIPYKELAGTPEGILTLRALKAQPVNELLSDAVWEEPLLFAISEDALGRILRYILNADSNVSLLKERIRKIHSKPLQTKTMTLADQLRQEGRQEGEQEGLIKGKREGLSEGQLLAFRTAVSRALEIRHGSCPEGIREALKAIKDPKRLEQLHEIAFRSESIEVFARKL
jgi:flagellar biosynthesis/type III secretory pathway protein FliH